MATTHTRVWETMDHLEQRQLLATVLWDGGAGTDSWHDAENWSTDQLPGVDDDVVIDVTGTTAVITHSANVLTSVRSIRNSEGLALSGGTIRTAEEFNQIGPMTMTGGVVEGAGDLIVRAGLDWSGGMMDGPGRTIVAAPGGIDIIGNVLLSRVIFNDGVIRWQSGNIVFTNGTIVIRPDGEMVIEGSGSAYALGGTGLWVNNGAMRRQGTATGVSTIGVGLVNTGDVEVLQGMLRLLSGGHSYGGTMTAADGATYLIAGPAFRVHAPAVIGGAGTFMFQTGTHSLAGAFDQLGRLVVQSVSGSAPRVTVVGADRSVQTVVLAGGFLVILGKLTVTSDMAWSAGWVQGPGRLTIDTGATLSMSGPAEKRLQLGTLEVVGTASLAEGFMLVRWGSVENRGQFTVSGLRIQSNVGTPSTFENHGTLRKVGDGTFQLMRLINSDTGVVDVRAGVLRLVGGGSSEGTIEVAEDAVLRITLVPFTIAGGTVTGAGDVRIETEVTWLAGTIGGEGSLAILDDPEGTLKLSGTGARVLARDTDNFGVILWSGGTLELAGSTLTNRRGRMLVSTEGGLIGSGTAPTIENRAVFTKFGSGNALFDASTVQWNNIGVVNVFRGSLALDPARVTQVAGDTLAGGRWRVFSGARLDLVGAELEVNNGEISLQGDTAEFGAIGTLRRNNGLLSIAGGPHTLDPVGGVFTNNGTLILRDAADLRIQGGLVLTPISRLETHVSSPTAFGRLTATGSLTLGGTTVGVFTFNPAPGSNFRFLTGASTDGEFATATATGLSAGLTAVIEYLPNGARWAVD